MKNITVLAKISAPQLSPQDFKHLKYMLEKELNRNGIEVEVYKEDK